MTIPSDETTTDSEPTSSTVTSVWVTGEADHDIPHSSFSQINQWLRCPRQYYYRYELGIKKAPSIAMASGTSIHAAFEHNNRHKIDTGEDEQMDVLLDITAEEHDKSMEAVEDATADEKGENKDENIEITRLHRRVVAPHVTPQTAEQPFTLHVPSDEYGDYKPVIGYIDTTALVPDPRDGPTKGRPVRAVEDYKRVNKAKSQNEVDLSIQLSLYDYVYELANGELPDVIGLRTLGYNALTSKAKHGPGPYSVPMYRAGKYMTAAQREMRHLRVIQQVQTVQRAIAAGIDVPVDDPKVCGWCGYREECQGTR